MRIFLLFFLLLITSSNFYGQDSTLLQQDTIHWSADYKLKWEDFQGIPDTISPGIAGTSSSFFYHSYYDSTDSLIFVIDCIFFKKYSWVKPSSLSSYSLNHEQGHFNITEVYARRLKAALKNYRLNKSTVIQDVKTIYDSIRKKEDAIQTLYDKETLHSTNAVKQKEWDNKIAQWLKINSR